METCSFLGTLESILSHASIRMFRENRSTVLTARLVSLSLLRRDVKVAPTSWSGASCRVRLPVPVLDGMDKDRKEEYICIYIYTHIYICGMDLYV